MHAEPFLKTFRTLLFLICLLGALPLLASSNPPVPEFFGVYIVTEGELVELGAHPQGSNPGLAIGGADLLRSISDVRVPNGNIEFVLYSKGAASLMKVPAMRVGRVEFQETLNFSGNGVEGRERFDREFWYPTNQGVHLRIAPMSANPELMVRLVPEQPLEPGVWALSIRGKLYDFQVGPDAKNAADCLVRISHITGVRYRRCSSDGRHGRRARISASDDPAMRKKATSSQGTAGVALQDIPVDNARPCKKAPATLPAGTVIAFGEGYDWTARNQKRGQVQVHVLVEGVKRVRCGWIDETKLATFHYPCDPPQKIPLTDEMVICSPFASDGAFSAIKWGNRTLLAAAAVASREGLALLLQIPAN